MTRTRKDGLVILKMASRARPRIAPKTQIFIYGRSTFDPNISDFFDLCLHLLFVDRVRDTDQYNLNKPWSVGSHIPQIILDTRIYKTDIQFWAVLGSRREEKKSKLP